MPCCNLLEIDCSTGTVNVSRHNFSGYAPWLEAGKTVNIDLSGGAECCTSETDCKILENKEQFAAQVLELALLYNLSGFTMDWVRSTACPRLSLAGLSHQSRWSRSSARPGTGRATTRR